jgi:hypothetical protein
LGDLLNERLLMNRKKNIRRGIVALAAISALAILIGCGGGGDGTTTGTTATTTGTTATTTGTTATTTGTTATTTSTTTTTTGTTAGALPPNAVFYTVGEMTEPFATQLRYIDMATRVDNHFATYGPEFAAVAPNPAVQNEIVFAASPEGTDLFGIYRNATVNLEGATQIVAPTYDQFNAVTSLQVSGDGQFLYYVGYLPGDTSGRLLRVPLTGGTPQTLDTDVTSAHLNSAMNMLVYAKRTNGTTSLFVREAAATGTAVQITEETFNEDFPQWSKDGTRIVFSSNRGGTALDPYDLWTMAAGGGDFRQITDTPNVDEIGASFDGTGTFVSFVALDYDNFEAGTGIYITGTSGINVSREQLVNALSVGDSTYWTSAQGRSNQLNAFILERRKKFERRN